jgi:hypothetical protein
VLEESSDILTNLAQLADRQDLLSWLTENRVDLMFRWDTNYGGIIRVRSDHALTAFRWPFSAGLDTVLLSALDNHLAEVNKIQSGLYSN